MSDELLNILSGSDKEPDNQKLLDYLNGKLSGAERHEFEKSLIDSAMMNDAVEGLEKLNKKEVSAAVKQLNLHLHKQLSKSKSKRQQRGIKDMRWLYLSIVLVLIIILIAFIVIKKYMESGPNQTFSIPASQERVLT